jgi:hypothetical protein
VCAARPVDMSPGVRLNVRLSGSYNSARWSAVFPPATSTWPLKRVVAVAEERVAAMLPTGMNCAAGARTSRFRLRAIFPFKP